MNAHEVHGDADEAEDESDDDGDDDDDDDGDRDDLVSRRSHGKGWLRGVRIENLTLAHADWLLPGDEPGETGTQPAGMREASKAADEMRMSDWQAAAFLSDAALVSRHAMHTRIANVEIRCVGGYAIWLRAGAANHMLENVTLRDMGAGGIRIGEMELTNLERRRGRRYARRRARNGGGGGGGGVAPAVSYHSIVRCRILSGGHVFREGVGVLVHRSQSNLIEDSEVAYLGYTGISLGWEWGYGEPSGGGFNVVRGNFVHHIGRHELSDMGGIYVLGHAEGTVIEGNVFAHVAPYFGYGWGIYLDEGASGVLARRNLVLRTRSAAFHLHFGFNNTVSENVFACAGDGDGDLALSIGEQHTSFHFTRNVVLRCPLQNTALATTPVSGSSSSRVSSVTVAVSDVGGVSAASDSDPRWPSSASYKRTNSTRTSSAPLPLAPAWMLWWKGEGSTPMLELDDNIYFSLVPHEHGEEPPPSLHFVRRGRTLRGWQKLGQDGGSAWADPGFKDAASCDFAFVEGSFAARRGIPPLVPPLMARGQEAGGDGSGCGEPVAPGRATPPPEPLEPPALPADELPSLQALSRLAPDGRRRLKQHRKAMARRAEEEKAQLKAQDEAIQSMRYHAAMHLAGHGVPCWTKRRLGRQSRYLPGCTQDGCMNHESLEEAAAVCELLGEACGGVTADETQASYQTRLGPKMRAGPHNEISWSKRTRC